MDDEGAAIRTIIARCFALQTASLHADDPAHHIELAEDFADWILGKEVYFGPTEAVRKAAEACLTAARLKLKKGKK